MSIRSCKNVLCIVAHPDDEVLMAGGTLRKYVQEGANVMVVYVCENDSRYNDKHDNWTSAINCTRVLGIPEHQVLLLNFKDQSLDTTPIIELAEAINRHVLSMISPDVVITHSMSDLNTDHRAVHEALMVCLRPQHKKEMEILAGYAASSTDWGASKFHPNVYVDVTNQMDDKLQAYRMYEAEQRPWPHARSEGGITAQAMFFGSHVGCEAAEAFELIRAVR